MGGTGADATATARALEGLKVVDLSRVLAGPYAAQILADLGADVVKVERPGKGDDTRSWGPPWSTAPDGAQGDASYFFAANRNKKSLAIDLKHRAGADIVRRLIAGADVVIENFKAGDLDRSGLGHRQMLAAHPGLVWCSITGFGHESPQPKRAGYDFMIQAEAGLMDITGEADGRPLKAGVAIADLTTGMMAATAILAALLHRDRTGEGQHIDMALFDVTLGWMANQATGWLVGGTLPRRMGNQHPSIVPYQDFATATGPIALAVGSDSQFRAFARIIGYPGWADEPRFATTSARAANRDALLPMIEAALKTRPAEEWLAAFEDAQVPAGPIATIPQALDSRQAKARGLVVEQPHPRLGMVRTVAQPLALTRTPPDYRLPPPMLGSHSRALLEGLGLTAEEIDALIADGVVTAA